jgi:hypothetical protein
MYSPNGKRNSYGDSDWELKGDNNLEYTVTGKYFQKKRARGW